MAIRQIKKIKVKTMPHDQPYLQAEKKSKKHDVDFGIYEKWKTPS